MVRPILLDYVTSLLCAHCDDVGDNEVFDITVETACADIYVMVYLHAKQLVVTRWPFYMTEPTEPNAKS